MRHNSPRGRRASNTLRDTAGRVPHYTFDPHTDSRKAPMRFITFSVAATILLVSAGCTGADDDVPEVSERERQEAIGNSGLPGAQGINGALDASDAMRARAEAHDTIR